METSKPSPENNAPESKNLQASENDEWIDTRREYDIDAAGNEVFKKVAREKRKDNGSYTKKEKVDLWFRVLSSLAIFIPLLLFTLNKRVADANEDKKYKHDVYGAIKTDIRFMQNKSVYSKEYADAKDDLFFRQYPKLGYINDTIVIAAIDSIQEIFKCYQLVSEIKIICDSIEEVCSTVYDHINNSYTNGGHVLSFEKQKADTFFYKKNVTYYKQLGNEFNRKTDELVLLTSSIRLRERYHDSLVKISDFMQTLDDKYTSHFNNLINYLEALQSQVSEKDQDYMRIKEIYYVASGQILLCKDKKIKSAPFFTRIIKNFQDQIKRIDSRFERLSRDH